MEKNLLTVPFSIAASRWPLAALLLLALAALLPQQAQAQQSISGTVFEDVNYGGGAGRNYADANASAVASGFVSGSIGRPNVRVELYLLRNGVYEYEASTSTSSVTGSVGTYTFSGLTGSDYYVRVVNKTVASSRPGASAGLPVQTFRTVKNTTKTDDGNRVGGESPTATDAGPNGGTVVTTSTAAGNITLAFQGLNSSGDNTLFLDNVQVLSSGTALATNPITNPDFENGTISGAFQYNPSGTGIGWTFSALSGIQQNNSAFTPPNTNSGNRAGFIQSNGGNNGVISQVITLGAGTYTLSFQAANRGFGGQQAINVAVNGTVVRANLQAVASGYTTYTTDAFSVGSGTGKYLPLSSVVPAQSISHVVLSAGDASAQAGIDFGFNFDVVVNTNDTGQGSLRQFVLNANALTNANLAQSGNRLDETGTQVLLPTTNHEESSIFMIADGKAHPGLLASTNGGPASGLNGGTSAWASVQLNNTGLALTDGYTVLDGTTQTANISDSNAGLLGMGGPAGQFPTVGTQTLAANQFGQFSRPEVEVYSVGSFASLVLVQAPNTTVRGLALRGAGGAGTLRADNVTNLVVENNLVGITPASIADPGQATSSLYGVVLAGTTIGATVRRNLVGYTSNSGIYVPSGGTSAGSSIVITGNELVQSGFRQSGGDNITVGDQGATGPVQITYNLIRSANSNGVQFDIGNVATSGTQKNVVDNNTFFDNGNGGNTLATSQLEGSAILYLQRSGSSTGTNADEITHNIMRQTQASGVVVGYGQTGIHISQNSTYFNGTPFNTPTGSNLGIDLISQANYFVTSNDPIGRLDYGNGDGVTPNNGSTTAAFGNAGIDYPVFTMATATGKTSPTVNVAGYVGSPAVSGGTSAFANATVEIYAADNVQPNNKGAVQNNDGSRVAHGEGRTYLGSLTTDATGYFSGQLTFPQGTPPLPATGVAATGYLTATAYLAAYGTSEFGPDQPVIASADVQTTITSPGTVTAKAQGTFTVTFTNQPLSGPVQADGVVATVQLPPNLTNVTVSAPSNGQGTGSYNASTGLVTYTSYSGNGVLANAATFSSTITYDQPQFQAVTATSTISTITSEGGLTANNSATATNLTNPRYNLQTTINGPTTATAGNQVAYVVTSTNVGGTLYPSPATSVTQTVSIPAGATNLYVTGGGLITGSAAAGYTVTFTTALAAGQSESQTVNFTAPASAYSVDAAISGTPADAITTDNTATTGSVAVSAATGGQANVFARITAQTPSVALGATGSFVLREGNNGPNAATGVRTTAVLPPGLTNVVVTDSVSGAASSSAYNATTGVITLSTIASQAPGRPNRRAYTISFTTPATGGVVTATANVLTTSPDQVPADNAATAQVTVLTPADLAVQLVGPSAATAGQPLTYTLTTLNNGPGPAQNVSQATSLPAGLPITGPNALKISGNAPTSTAGSVATYGTGAAAITYDATTGRVTLPVIAILTVGQSTVTTFAYRAPANNNQSLSISAAANSAGINPSLANNVTSLLTTVKPAFDVEVMLSGTGQAEPGNPITFVVLTVNNGPSTVPGVNTTVNLPVSLSITGANALKIDGNAPTSTAGNVASYGTGAATITYDAGSGLVTYPTITNLLAGSASAVVSTLSFVLPTGYQGTLATTATALPTTTNGLADDDLPNNNTATTQPLLVTADTPGNDLSVTLTPSATTVAAGAPVSLTLQLANSATGATATNILPTVQLPAGLTIGTGTVTVTAGGTAVAASYDNESGQLTLPSISTLSPGSNVTYTIAISQAPGTGPLLVSASIGGGELESAPADNSKILSITITPSAVLQAGISGPASASAGATVTYLVSATNTGLSASTGTAQTVTVPSGATNVLLNGVAVTPGAGGVLALPVPATLLPGGANTVSNTLTFTAPGAAGSSFTVPTSLTASGPGTVATATASQLTRIAAPGPVARDIVNSLQAPAATTAAAPQAVLPLTAVANGSLTISNFIISSLPPTDQGTLYVGSTPLTAANFPGLLLTPTQATNLFFQPVSGYVGNATFTYYATDNNGVPSNIAHYLVPVGPDLDSQYQNTPSKGGANPYQNSDIIAYVLDVNGAQYNTAGKLYQATGTLVDATAKSGVSTTYTTGTFVAPVNGLNNLSDLGLAYSTSTGEIYVADRRKLKAGSYTVPMTTTDYYGGVTTQNVPFSIGTMPLPVTLTAFTAQAAGNRDALLQWSTATEINNASFEVERSFDGVAFAKIGQVAGQGNKLTPTNYTLTDANVAAKASGPVYYRLRQVDQDGTAAYSPVRSVSFTLAAGLALYPNPASARTTLDLTQLPIGTYQVTLTDVLGQAVRRFTQAGGTAQALDVQDLSTGSYQMQVVGAACVYNLRFTKE
ncbi:MAG: T9SS type A sorting domain-containing protein [Janthinobacterium lividum]